MISRKTKILVVCQYYFPENFQINGICEQLVTDGYEVTVLTGLPNYPLGEVPKEYINDKSHWDEIINGVHVIRCYERGRGKGALNLVLNYLSFYMSAMRKVKKLERDFDVVLVYQLSPVTMGLPARWYAKNRKKPLLLYCCDLWPESIKMYIRDEANPIFKVMKKISRYVYDSCDEIMVQSKSFITYLESVHEISKNITYLPAFADEKYLEKDFTPIENGVIDFVFMGNLGIAQDLPAVIKAFHKAKQVANIKLHIVGDGSVLGEIKTLVSELAIDAEVCFYGRRPVEEMEDFYKLADACLVSLKADNAVGLTLPSKVQGYMAAGKPIVGMIDGSTEEVISESECGICVKASNIDELANALIEFSSNIEKYKDCGENGRKYFMSHFRKSIFMENLEKCIDDVLCNW